jgi:hypothetical protein
VTKAGRNRTPPYYYSEETCAVLRAHIEKVAARRKVPCNVDWSALWDELERIAGALEPLPGERLNFNDTIRALTKCQKAADVLLQQLNNPALTNWDFDSVTSNSVTGNRLMKRLIKIESPRRLRPLIENLVPFRDELEADIAELQKFAKKQKMHALDREARLLDEVLDIGHELFGQQVGGSDGPLIKFVQLALRPVLGDATPSANALRISALRRSKPQ